jgi:hypothetical protein
MTAEGVNSVVLHDQPVHNPERPREAVLIAIVCALALSAIALIAAASHLPWVFPSLGPTAFILFATPLSASASTKHTICAHLIGVFTGLAALAMFGLLWAQPDLNDVSLSRAGAVAVCTALTAVLMLVLKVPHAPAMATTLIVALGMLRSPKDIAVMTLAVLTLVIFGRLVNHLRGYRLPWWEPVKPEPDGI